LKQGNLMKAFNGQQMAWVFGLTAWLQLLGAVPARAVPVTSTNISQLPGACEAMADVDFSKDLDAPTHISDAQLIVSTPGLLGDVGIPAMPALAALAVRHIGPIHPYCRVRGYVAASVGFELLLPTTNWNGKFLHVGCAGWCGTLGHVGLGCARHPGYACIGTDMGHRGTGGLALANNLQAQVDFSYRATHVATLAGKALTERFYGSRPKKSYFIGCSTGGYQGLVEAQRYPWDFDGIVAGAPDMDESDLAVRSIWIKQNFMGPDEKPILNSSEIQLLHEAALAQCDLDDGLKDGIISDPLHCGFDPATLLCKDKKTRQCLNPQQVRAVKNIYGVPVNSRGVVLSTRGVLPGSELSWEQSFAHVWGESYFEDMQLLSPPGTPWNYRDFNFDTDVKRSGVGVLFPSANPDLREFDRAGGKLITYQGTNDTAEIPGAVFDYYETVQHTLGGRRITEEFYRHFAVPAMDHCTGGDGAFSVDYLSYMERWVEEGHPPEVMIGVHIDGLQKSEGFVLNAKPDPDATVRFTRPLYPYPQYARYSGHGDPNKAENFEPVTGSTGVLRDIENR